MIRFLPVWLCIVAFTAIPVLGQQSIPITTFTVTELQRDLASIPLPSNLRDNLSSLLDQAQRAYDRGSRLTAVPFLNQFETEIQSQPANVISDARASDLARRASLVADALADDINLGGAVVGPEGAVLQVADTNSPVFRARLTIPPGAIAQPTFVSISVISELPANRVLTFVGSGLALGPPGLGLASPATLDLPFDDLERDGIIDGTDFPTNTIKVGVADFGGRIAFPRALIDTAAQMQAVEVYDFASYWNVAWRWPPGVLTYKLSWPVRGVTVTPGFDMNALGDAVRSAMNVWSSALEPAGISFREVPENQPAAIRFGFFSTDTPLSVLNSASTPPLTGLVPGLGRGLGDGAAQVYARENPIIAGEGFAITFNSNFGSTASSLSWTPDHTGNASAVSIEAVAVHAVGHVMGLGDIPDTVQPPVMATGADLLSPEVCLAPDDVDSLFELYRVSDPNAFPSCPHTAIEGLPEAFDFGEVRPGEEMVSSFTVRNVGTGSLSIRSITAEGEFELEAGDTELTLGAGEATSFRVRFAPETPGAREGVVRVVSNGPDAVVPVWLLGSGPYPVPDCTISSSLARMTAGESSTLNWTSGGYAETAEINNGIGSVSVEVGSIEVAPDTTTRYVLTVSNEAGSDTCDATIEVTRAASSELLWTRQFGTTGDDAVRAVEAGDFGVFVAGEVGGTVNSVGEGFVALYDIAGDRIWERRFGGARIEGLAVDASGVYVAGLTERSLEDRTDSGAWDVAVRKYDFDGNELWADRFGGDGADRASAIAADGSGVYVAGLTDGAINGGLAAIGGLDVFVLKYSVDGTRLWSRQFGTSSDDFARDIETTSGGIVVVGDTAGTLSGQTARGGSDAFLRKYTVDGEEVWTHQFGAAGSEFIATVVADATGFYVAGGVETALPGQVSRGGFDAFVRKYDNDGIELWTRQFGTALTDRAAAIGVDTTGVFVVGATEGTLPGQVSFGQFDAFVRAYDLTGEETWTRYVGTGSVDDVFAVSPYHLGVYVAGSTLGTFDGAANIGATDAYLGKILK